MSLQVLHYRTKTLREERDEIIEFANHVRDLSKAYEKKEYLSLQFDGTRILNVWLKDDRNEKVHRFPYIRSTFCIAWLCVHYFFAEEGLAKPIERYSLTDKVIGKAKEMGYDVWQSDISQILRRRWFKKMFNVEFDVDERKETVSLKYPIKEVTFIRR